MSEQNIKSIKDRDQIKEVSALVLFLFLKRNFLKISIGTILAMFIGYIGSYLFTPTYKSQTTLLPEYSMGASNSFVSMAMGIKTGEGAENLVPELYPNILKGYPFGIYLLKQPVIDQNNVHYKTLQEYLRSKKTTSFIRDLFSGFGKKDSRKTIVKLPDPEILVFSKEQEDEIKNALSLAKATLDKVSQTIKIESVMKDPVVAAMIAEVSKKYLINYVEEYRSEKARQNANFLEGRVSEAKRRLQNAEVGLQAYRDRNRNTFLNLARIEEQRLQSEFTMSQSLYSDLVQKLEQARIKVKQEKPVFKVLEPVQVPLATNSPRRLIMALISGILGGLGIIFYLVVFKERLLSKYLLQE